MNGRLVDADRATVPFLTPALHYGAAVFEGIRCYDTPRGPAIFRLREHIRRLARSAHVLGFRALPYDEAALVAAVVETVRASGLAACYIRPLIYLAGGGWNLTIDGGEAHVGIAVWPWPAYMDADARDRGIRANVSSFTRLHPNVAMTKAKIAGNYANSFLARTESLRLGFEEAILLDPQGYVAECAGENLFVVDGGILRTPPAGAILVGITRDTILVLARDAGLAIVETMLSRDDLYIADEVFVCGTAAEVLGIREIDMRQIGSGATGEVTRRLQQAYHSAVEGTHSRSADWLTYVS
jgi:branched-chain amino acid aminotransferase